MKAFYSSISLFLLLTISVHSQVTITSASMPVSGDSILVSQANAMNSADPAITGFDVTWDYSTLVPLVQRVVRFVGANQTPPLYQIVFNPLVANLASPIEGLDFFDGEVTEAYTFYKNTSAEYVSPGFAATIYGIPVPFKYNLPERLYKFPLTSSSLPDSSISDLSFEYPGFGFVSVHRKRVNTVDGSGELTTPFGTFNTIRQKSVVYEYDSIYYDSLQTGFPVVRNFTEYKWLSPDYPLPILTITQEGLLLTAEYLDTIHNLEPLAVSITGTTAICQGESTLLTASVEGGELPYTYLWSTLNTTQNIIVSPLQNQTYSVLVVDNNNLNATATVEISVTEFEHTSLGNDTLICAENDITLSIMGEYNQVNWFINNDLIHSGATFTVDSTGIGIGSVTVKATYHKESCSASDEIMISFEICGGLPKISTKQLTITPNPVTSTMAIMLEDNFKTPTVTITDITGNHFIPRELNVQSNRIDVNVEFLKPGLYFIIVEDNDTKAIGKFIKQ